MIRRWRQFFALEQGDRWLAIEAALLLTIVQVGLRTVPFGMLRLMLARAKRLRARYQRDGSRSARAAGAAASVTAFCRAPFTSARSASMSSTSRPTAAASVVPLRNCLRDALAADVMLARRGFQPTLRFGIRKPDGNRLTLDAHAWLECDGSIVAGRLESLDEYLVLSNPATTGRL